MKAQIELRKKTALGCLEHLLKGYEEQGEYLRAVAENAGTQTERDAAIADYRINEHRKYLVRTMIAEMKAL